MVNTPLLTTLSSLINAEFGTTHSQDKDDDKVYFCVDCGGSSISKKQKNELTHDGHKVFRAVKYSGEYCYKKDDIESLGVDVSEVSVHTNKETSVYYPKPRSSSHQSKKFVNYGLSCEYWVKQPALFCSLSCKFQWDDYEDQEQQRMRKELGECSTCGTKLIRKTVLFCSLNCKIWWDEDHEWRRQATKD